jgi:hypothetical protein
MLANPLILILFTGAEGQNRTADTGIFSPLLYRLSYLGMTLKKSKIIRPPIFCQDIFGSYHQKDIATKHTLQRWLFQPLRFEALIRRW